MHLRVTGRSARYSSERRTSPSWPRGVAHLANDATSPNIVRVSNGMFSGELAHRACTQPSWARVSPNMFRINCRLGSPSRRSEPTNRARSAHKASPAGQRSPCVPGHVVGCACMLVTHAFEPGSRASQLGRHQASARLPSRGSEPRNRARTAPREPRGIPRPWRCRNSGNRDRRVRCLSAKREHGDVDKTRRSIPMPIVCRERRWAASIEARERSAAQPPQVGSART